MLLEIRDKNGVLVAKINGKTALFQYQRLAESNLFKCERTQFKKSDSNEYEPHLIFRCVEYAKIFVGDVEIWMGIGDYVKIL